MPQFIGRPRFFEELSQMALQMQAQNPIAQALGQGLGGIGEALAKRGMQSHDIKARADLQALAQQFETGKISAGQAFETQKATAGNRADLVKSMLSKGYQIFDLSSTPGAQINAGQTTRLTDALRAMGIQPGQGDQAVAFRNPQEKTKPGVVPLTATLIGKIKPVLDLSEFEGREVGLDTINHLMTQARLMTASGGGGKVTPEQQMRKQAIALAAREHIAAMNDPMIMDKSVIPPVEEMADTYFKYLMNQKSTKGKPSLSDLFMRSLLPEATGGVPEATPEEE